ncbi:gluconokinase [Cohaesibacter celericrescens]|nr:gluconokinase [Cohaesibacter celericrescens]
MIIVVMGISGTGKSTLGRQIAEHLGVPFVEGDDFHSPQNVSKMAAGQPLTNEDRQPWLASLASAMSDWASKNETRVVSCSALRKQYRDCFRSAASDLRFLFLDGSLDLVRQRMQQRDNHFMPAELVESQMETLEYPVDETDVIRLDVSRPTKELVDDAVSALQPSLS